MPDAVIVGAGVAGWDGGTDLFLDVARRLADDPGLELWWVGRRSRGAARRLDLDAELMGVRDRVVWSEDLEPGTAPAVVIVTARTDGARNKAIDAAPPTSPIVCFALPDVGPTDVRDRAGGDPVQVPFPDTNAMAQQVRTILERGGASAR